MRGDGLDSSYSLQDRRAAKLHIKFAESLPPNAQVIGDFTVQRCHQYLQDASPSESVLADDLTLLAYSQGADGITNVRFDKESGLLKNCWFVAKAVGTFFKVKPD